MLTLLLLLLAGSPARAHMYIAAPPTRALCYHEGATSDAVYRAAPCGRPSRGVQGVLVAGAEVCIRSRMNVPHMGPFRVAIAPGTAPVGEVFRGTRVAAPGSFAAAFDVLVLGAWSCSDVAGGCPAAATPAQTGDFSLSLRLPSNLTAMLRAYGGGGNNSSGGGGGAEVATVQLRQYAHEFVWYYHDCADVLVVDNATQVPAELAGAWAAVAGPCPGLPLAGNATASGGFAVAFTQRSYSPTYYAGIIPATLGTVGLAGILLLLGDVVWLWCAARATRRRAGLPLTSSPPPTAAAIDSDLATGKLPQAAAAAVPTRCCCSGILAEAHKRRWLLLAHAGVVAVALAVTGGVISMLPTCALRPSPEFGP